MIRTKFIFVFFILVLSIGVSFGQNPNPKTIKAIETHLAKIEKLGYSGAVLVAVKGKPVISRGYGFSDREQKIKSTPKTILDTGSVTKQFTAAAILKLEMQGKLSTDDKITKYFQNVPADKADITIHDLLRHSSGLRGGIGQDFDKISEAEFIEKVLASELRFPIGKEFGYSNIGYSLLALIVEKLSGQTYEQYLYSNLWKPSGMEMTGYTRPAFDKSMIAVGYRIDERWGKPTDKAWAGDAPYLHLKGNGGVLSTTEDMLKWDVALAGEKILSKEAKRKYYFPTLRPDEAGRKSYYGYGWDVTKTDRNTYRIWHNGTNRVFYADFYRFIDEGVTIIIMTNTWQDSFIETGRSISRMIFEPGFEPVMPIVDNPANRAFTDELIQLTLKDGFAAATDKFVKRAKGVEVLERVVNSKGYDLLEEKKFKETIDMFRLNTFAFPRSSNAFDSLGEAYLESGDKKSAIESYKKALELDPDNGNAKEVLERIGGK